MTLTYIKRNGQRVGAGPVIPPLSPRGDTITINATNTYPKENGIRANASILDYDDGYLYSYRNRWKDANISIYRMNKQYEAQGELIDLRLVSPHAMLGREDGRLFWHRGHPHIWYSGWMGSDSRYYYTNQCYAKLHRETLDVIGKYHPVIPWRNLEEKNHAYFSHDGYIYGVYTIKPHVVMKIDGDKIIGRYQTEFETTWKYGHIRGGASPVWHNGEFYHFFHGMTYYRGDQRLYTMGVYTFEAKPPFRITRFSHSPIDYANPRTNPNSQWHHVIFPGGAVRRGDGWAIAMGVHDQWSEVRHYSDVEVESALHPL